jgi:hypothetical protein
MEDELLEQMAEKVHDSWWEEKKRQGFHMPRSDCPLYFPEAGAGMVEGYEECDKCHKDMKPYAELDEAVKELDRVMVRQFEEHLGKLNHVIIPTEMLALIHSGDVII